MNEPHSSDSIESDDDDCLSIESMIERAFRRFDKRMNTNDYNGFEDSQFLSESALEDVFWDIARKTNRDKWLDVQAQWKIGNYTSDAMFRSQNGITLVELDGKAYHDRARDLSRDWWILQNAKDVRQIIRVPYAAMMFRSRAAFRVLEHWEPSFAIARDIRVIDAQDFFENELPSPDQCGESGYEQWFKESNLALDLVLIDTQWERFAWIGSAKAMVFGHKIEPIRRISRELYSIDATTEAIDEHFIRMRFASPLHDRFKIWLQSWS